MKTIFLNADRKVRSIWWVPIFYLLMAAFLIPTILVAKKYSADIPLSIQSAIILLATVICLLLRREPIRVITGTLDFQWLRQFFKGLLMGGALMVFPALALTLAGVVHWQIHDLSLATLTSGLTLFALVAVSEELLFRGFLFQRLIESLGPWPAQLIVAGMFLLTHTGNPGMTGTVKVWASVNIFVASIMFGLAFLRTKSLAMPLGLHVMANFMQGTVLGFGVSGEKEPSLFKAVSEGYPSWVTGGAFGLEASLLGLLAVIVTTIYLYRSRPAEPARSAE